MDSGPIFRPDPFLREVGPASAPRDAGPVPASWESTNPAQRDPSLALVVLLLVAGTCALLVNSGLASQTKGYSEGRLNALGERVVSATAWIGLALMGLVVFTRVYALIIALGVLLLLGVAVGRDSRA